MRLVAALLAPALATDAALRLVDLETYPIDRLSSKLLAPLQREWLEGGRVSLKGFLTPATVTQMVDEVKDLPSFRRLQVVRSYGIASPRDSPKTGDAEHPTETLWAQDVFAVAGDQIANSTLLRQLYQSTLFANFVAQVLGLPRIYRYDDRYQDLNVTQLFRGQLPTIVSRAEPGTVTIFNGRRSMHRARASYGAKTRILAIFSYDTQASVNQTRPDLDKNVRLYGERVKYCTAEE